MTSVLVPVGYLAALIGSLIIFSRFYRKRAAAQLQRDPWWPTHPERDVYISLLQQTDPPAPEYLLKAALLKRAVADVTRIHSMREDKQAATVLVQKGSVGDDLLTRLQTAEKELETEILEVVGEANSFKEGWGTFIFQTASEMLANEKTRKLYGSMEQQKVEILAKYGKKKFSTANENSPLASGSLDSPKPVSPASPSNPGSEIEETPQSVGTRGKKGKRRK